MTLELIRIHSTDAGVKTPCAVLIQHDSPIRSLHALQRRYSCWSTTRRYGHYLARYEKPELFVFT